MDDMLRNTSKFPNHIEKIMELKFRVQNYFNESMIFFLNRGVIINESLITLDPSLSEQERIEITFRINYFNKVMHLYSNLVNLMQSNQGSNEELNRLIKDLETVLHSKMNGTNGMHEEIRPVSSDEEGSYSSFEAYIKNNLDLNVLDNSKTFQNSDQDAEC